MKRDKGSRTGSRGSDGAAPSPLGDGGSGQGRAIQWRSACTPEQVQARGSRKPVNLALQGGGAHGAFGWGVLDRLLEDGRLAPDAISATSAGAMNAVVMAIGISEGGFDGARAKLQEFWSEISRAGRMWNPLGISPWRPGGDTNGRGGGFSLGFMLFEAVTRLWSPYQLNPFDLNPLRDVLVKVVDFERLRKCPHATRLFLSATNVRTSKIRVFENHETTPSVVLASACLPYIFKAVEVEGEHYWDGGFMGNPAIFPLIYRGASRDVIVVHINPIVRESLPYTAPEIFDRMNEISFNSSLMREMRAIAFVTRLIEEEAVDPQRYQRMLIHSIRDDTEMSRHGAESKLDPSWEFITHLRDAGRAAAGAWLEENFAQVGHRTTVDLAATYL
jgi:NTE family protein